MPLINVPLDDLMSLMKTLSFSHQTSACARERTLLSKYPLTGLGTVLLFEYLPIFMRLLELAGAKLICLGTNVSLRG